MYQDNYPVYSNKLLKSINGGYNWTIIDSTPKTRTFQFINDTIGFASGYNEISYFFSKTIDGGFNWITTNTFSNPMFPIYFVNTTTGWIGGYNDNTVLYRTTDGGVTFHQQVNKSGGGVSKIQFINQPYNGEYYGYRTDAGSELYRTTNSGWNWVKVLDKYSIEFYFINKDTGWAVHEEISNMAISYTTNGGINWNYQLLFEGYPSPEIFFSTPEKGWRGRGGNKIYTTSNGGTNWGTQSIPIYYTSRISAINGQITWACYTQLTHTTDGGGIITSTGNRITTELSGSTELFQNYPNPFNHSSIINYKCSINGMIGITVYDLSGKEVRILVNEYKPAGIYQVRFDAEGLPSGIYFCRLSVDGVQYSIKKLVIIK